MEHSPLGRLPPELRNNIYELVFKQMKPVTIFYLDGAWNRHHLTHDFALTKTCKQIHAETSQLFYSGSTFMLIAQNSNGEASPCPHSLISRMGEANTTAMRTLHINLFIACHRAHLLRSILRVVREIPERRELMAKCWVELRFRVHGVGLGRHLRLVWDPQDLKSVDTSRQQCLDRIDAWAKDKENNNGMLEDWDFSAARDLRAVLKEVC